MSASSEKEEYWKEQAPLFNEIYRLSFSEYSKKVKGLEKGFPEQLFLRCIDEGTPGGIHLAGSGLLFGEKLPANVKGIYTHQGCGAAKLYAIQKGLKSEYADFYYILWVKELAKKLGIKYMGHICGSSFRNKLRKGEMLEALPAGREQIEKWIRQEELKEILDLPEAGHISSKDCTEELKRPEDFHIARVTYYDGTGKFDPTLVPQLPPGFVISRRYTNRKYAAVELGVSISIAFGDHGFGELITKKSPFIICAIGDRKAKDFSLEKLTAELEKIVTADDTIQKHIEEGRIRVDGFTAPQ